MPSQMEGGVAHMDFVQRVEAQEQVAAEDPMAFRRQVAALSLLAVLWVWGGLLIGLALLAWAVLSFVGNGFQGLQIFGFFGAMALLLSVLRLTRSDWVVPDGIHVPLAQCPRLLEALERIRQKIGGPRIDQFTWVLSPCGVSVNSAMLWPSNGLMKSS